MLKKFIQFSLLLGFTVSAANAAVAVVEASTMTRPGYVVFYTGACAERIGMKIARTGYQRGEDAMPGLIKQARSAVPHFLKLCPKAETIAVDVRADGSQQAHYFTMSRADGWNPTASIGNGGLKSLLDDNGYRLIAGPLPVFSQAYLRFEDGRFDMVYGAELENRMVATHIERRPGEGQGADSYLVRGQFYDLGFHESERKCETSRESYAAWGTFTMTVSPTLSDLPLTIKWCADHDEAGTTENTEFFDMPWYGAKDRQPPSTAQVLADLLANSGAVIDVKTSDSGAREPLIDREFYRVYSSKPDLCAHRELDVVYRVNSERRDGVFSGSYLNAVGNVVGNLVGRRCDGGSGFTVNSFSADDAQRWDRIDYRYNQSRGVRDTLVRVSRRTLGAAAEAHEVWLQANEFGPACDGPFCELRGGRYLNAIYRGDLDNVRQIDHMHKQVVQQFMAEQSSVLGAGVFALAYDAAFNVDQLQLLRDVANKYMHTYAVWGESCLDAGSGSRTFSYTTPVVIETDEFGTTTSGGIEYKATYTLNPEFFPLRDKLGSHRGAKRSDNPTNLRVKAAVYEGLVELARTGDCRSAEVKQLEQQLRRLTSAVLASPGTLKPSVENSPPKKQRKTMAVFPPVSTGTAGKVAWNAPVPLPTWSNAKRGGASKPPMTQQERYEQMNVEMKALQAKYEKDLQATQTAMAAAQKRRAPQAELMQIMQDSQAKMMALQQQFQAEMLQIQQKYQ
ncbi:MAG: hypothetical protein AB8F65_01055 [Woeseiaceae bacterium]